MEELPVTSFVLQEFISSKAEEETTIRMLKMYFMVDAGKPHKTNKNC